MKLIAEIGLNHDYATPLIDKAAEVGFDGVKFQYWRVEDFESPYQSGSLRHWQMSRTALAKSCRRARSLGLTVIISPTISTLTEAVLESDFVKISSDMANKKPFLDKLDTVVCPLILSTGFISIAQVMALADRFNERLEYILHCVSRYPHLIEDSNMERIASLRGIGSDAKIGYSDHTVNHYGSMIAAAKGVEMIEVHVGIESFKTPDSCVSLDIGAMKDFVSTVRAIADENS